MTDPAMLAEVLAKQPRVTLPPAPRSQASLLARVLRGETGPMPAPTEAQSGNGSVLSSPDGRLMIVGVQHGASPDIPGQMRDRIRSVGEQQGFYYEGNGGDRDPVAHAFGDLAYRGSWDAMVTAPASNRAPFLYTLFSNPPSAMAGMVDRLAQPSGTIADSLYANRDHISHEAVRGQLTRDDITEFLRRSGFEGDANKPASRENIQGLLQRGEAQMWPDNWQDFPNPAGKLAQEAESHRLQSVIDRGAGVYFMGRDNLPLMQRLNPELAPTR